LDQRTVLDPALCDERVLTARGESKRFVAGTAATTRLANARRITRRRVLVLLLLGLALIPTVSLAVWIWETKAYRAELSRARREFRDGRFGAARMRLVRLEKRWPRQAEIAYWLGKCDRETGNTEAAIAAWGRVPDDAREAPLAALARGEAAIDVGRFALGERCLDRASRAGGKIGEQAREHLARLHLIMGRHDEYRSYLRRQIARTGEPSESLRLLWAIDHEPYPVDGMRRILEEARNQAPDDDRVWLGLADLATRSGQLAEAGRWLDRCERARPDDHVVARARLDWAHAADLPDHAARAASRLPAAVLPENRRLLLMAWFAARRGDRQAERAALERLVEREPDDPAGFERLADLASQEGERDRLAELRRRKAKIDDARNRYRSLIDTPDRPSHAAELGALAETMGRAIDARAWWALASRRAQSTTQAEAALARLPPLEPAPVAAGGSLAELLGPLPSRGSDKPVLTSHLRVPSFSDDARERGVEFTFDNGRSQLRHLPETGSGGVALLDYDGDGWLDIYAVQGGKFPPSPGSPPPFGDRLFRNRDDGRFEDTTAAAGLASLPGGYGYGVAVGDYDNDGRPDLFVTRWRSYALYHNLGGKFEDVTARAGLGGSRDWPTSAAWADLDNDGDLDLYVCHYLHWEPGRTPPCERPDRDEYAYCTPRVLPSLPDHVFRNDGGVFVDVTADAGIVDQDGRGLGVVAADLDEDGKLDLYVANDMSANFFFRNLGGFHFSEQGQAAGLAASASGGFLAGMGIACGDFDGDGLLDLAVTNFYGESTTLYHNHGGGYFSDRAPAAGLATATRCVLGFGLAALDANNDGRLDLAQSNGHVDDYRPTIPYPMRPQLFLGDGAGKLVDVSDRAGAPWQSLRLGRGLAAGDIDNDGRIDLLFVAQNAGLALFRNQPGSPEARSTTDHFLTLMLEGTESNRDAIGARVTVTASGKTQMGVRFGGGSYLSSSDPRLHFGLGPACVAERVEVSWPSGRRDCYRGLAADSGYRLIEGTAAPRPLAGFRLKAIDR
jgi:tetratricopeptide (TPR) repeat protein